MERAARPRPGRRTARKAGRPTTPSTGGCSTRPRRHRLAGVRRAGHRGARARARCAERRRRSRCRTRGRGRPVVLDRTAVLRGVRRPGRRRRRPHLGTAAEVEVLDVQRPVKGLVVHQVRVARGRAAPGRRRWRPRSTRVAAQAPARRTRAPTWCTPRCARCSARRRCSPAPYNRPGYLRLDFAWQRRAAPEPAQRHRGGRQPGRPRRPAGPAQYMTLPEAQAFGALALFGETYGEQVRVVEIGGPWSRELCGGTHVRGSAQIGTARADRRVLGRLRHPPGRGGRRARPRTDYLARERDIVDRSSPSCSRPRPTSWSTGSSGMLARLQGRRARARPAQVVPADGEHRRDHRHRHRRRGDAHLDVPGARRCRRGGAARAGRQGPVLRPRRGPRARRRRRRPGRQGVARRGHERCRARPGLSAAAALRAALPAVAGRGGGKDDLAQGGGTDPAGVEAALAAVVEQVRSGPA